jgi:glycosyltransferase involved in cell wall biosynthesis
MHFILHSEIDETSIAKRLGQADYNYYFVLRAFKPALELLGSVEIVRDPNSQVDPIFDRCTAKGEDCYFFCFAPPHKVPFCHQCPTVIVFGWEYPDIPEEIWDDAGRSDWRVTLAALGGAITLSNYAAKALKRAMGKDYPVAVIPGAVCERFARFRDNDGYEQVRTPAEFRISGKVFDTRTLGPSADRLVPPIRPASIRDGDFWQYAQAELRSMALKANPPGEERSIRVRLDGVVYTTILNPSVNDKNLDDVVTAFCYAFRDTPDATLVLKIVHWDDNAYRDWLLLLLSRLGPFACRVIAIDAYLDEDAMEALIASTSYYLNASRCEALGQSLMEFMSCGRPAVAPKHTAMADYIDEDVAFVVGSASQLGAWPHDPRQMFRSKHCRIDWQSLRDALIESYRVAKESPDLRIAMGRRAMVRIQELTATNLIAQRLRAYLQAWRARPVVTAPVSCESELA